MKPLVKGLIAFGWGFCRRNLPASVGQAWGALRLGRERFAACRCVAFVGIVWAGVLNWHTPYEKVEAYAEAISEAHQLVCSPAAAAIDLGVES